MTLEVTERLFECCYGGDVVDRSAVEGYREFIDYTTSMITD